MDTMPQSPVKSGMKYKWLIGLLIVILLLAIFWFAGGKDLVMSKMVKSEYQSVFLTNGQVYFGKLSHQGPWLKLTDVYYLQVKDQLQPAGDGSNPAPAATDPGAQQNIQLVKLGSELHGPTDEMFIDKDKVIFWENMKDDSKVLAAIKQYKAK